MKNNSSEMKTIVETFIIEETAELIYDNESLDKWNELVKSLGLQGQKCLVKTDKSPIPFMHIKQTLENVFKVLCPARVDVEEYDVTPIPMEILSLVALSKNEGYFTKVEIWYDEKKPDPLAIGIKGYWYQSSWDNEGDSSLNNIQFESKEEAINAGVKNPHHTERNKYLIGKWADVKRSLEDLKKMAYSRFVVEETVRIKQDIKYKERELEDIENTAVGKFG